MTGFEKSLLCEPQGFHTEDLIHPPLPKRLCPPGCTWRHASQFPMWNNLDFHQLAWQSLLFGRIKRWFLFGSNDHLNTPSKKTPVPSFPPPSWNRQSAGSNLKFLIKKYADRWVFCRAPLGRRWVCMCGGLWSRNKSSWEVTVNAKIMEVYEFDRGQFHSAFPTTCSASLQHSSQPLLEREPRWLRTCVTAWGSGITTTQVGLPNRNGSFPGFPQMLHMVLCLTDSVLPLNHFCLGFRPPFPDILKSCHLHQGYPGRKMTLWL